MMSASPEERSSFSKIIGAVDALKLPFGLRARIALPAVALLLILPVVAFSTSRSSEVSVTSEVFRSNAILGAALDPDQSIEANATQPLNWLLISGGLAHPDGTIDSPDLPPSDARDELSTLPVIQVPSDALTALLADSAAQEAHIESLAALEASGIVLDYGLLTPDQAAALPDLVTAVYTRLAESDRTLVLRVPTPDATGEGWDAHSYDWSRLAASTDYIMVMPPGSPAEYHAEGQTARFIEWASQQVPTTRLLFSVSALSIDEWGTQLNPIAYPYSLAPVGTAAQDRTDLAPTDSANPGDSLIFRMVGDAANLQLNATSATYSYDFLAGDGTHRIWVTTGASLRARLDWLAQFGAAGIIVEDYFSPDASPAVQTALKEFASDELSSLSPELRLHWWVTNTGGAVYEDVTTDLGTSFTWQPSDEGEYLIRVEVVGDAPVDRGAAALIVGGETVGVAPNQEAVVEGAPDLSGGVPTPVASIPGGMPAPVVPPTVYGNFELGGQLNGVITNAALMHQSGMSWVKFQLPWGVGVDASASHYLIKQARDAGFKVLLSIPGQQHYPQTIDVQGYLEFLRGVAYYGPDAIEVWNEANLDYEWPRGQISGTRYVQEMLAPAYNAIKSVNPNIMVISGALAPTGAFYGDGGCSKDGYGCDDWFFLQQMAQAGAANYMDCVGVHYNSGATSPTVGTGHPADPGYQHYSWYYSGMVQLYGGTFGRPLCFTELGYLSGEGLGSVPERFSWAQDTSVAEQSQWLAEAVQMSAQNGNIRLLIVWNFDFTYWGDDPMAGFAMVRPDGSCPACAALDQVMP